MFSMTRTFIIFSTIAQLEQILSKQGTSGDTNYVSQQTTGIVMVRKEFILVWFVDGESTAGSLVPCSLIKLHLKRAIPQLFVLCQNELMVCR